MSKPLSKAELMHRLLWGFHPTPPVQYRDENWLSGKGVDLRLIERSNGSLEWAQASRNRSLKRLPFNTVLNLVASNMSAMLTAFDWRALVELAELKAMGMDKISTEESMVIPEYEIKAAAFADDPAWTWNRIPFVPSLKSDPGLWKEVLSRITTNAVPFTAWLYSLFRLESDRTICPWVYGPGGVGKSRMLQSIMDLFGSAAETKDASRPLGRFGLSSIENLRLLHWSEACPDFIRSPNWKSLTGEKRIEIERKYQDTRMVELMTKFVISSNVLPNVPPGNAALRRLMLVNFDSRPNTVLNGEEVDVGLADGMAWLLAIGKQAYEQGALGNIDHGTLTDLKSNDASLNWFNTHFVHRPDAYIPTWEIMPLLEALPLKTKQAIRQEIETEFGIKTYNQTEYINGIKTKVWRNLAWNRGTGTEPNAEPGNANKVTWNQRTEV